MARTSSVGNMSVVALITDWNNVRIICSCSNLTMCKTTLNSDNIVFCCGDNLLVHLHTACPSYAVLLHTLRINLSTHLITIVLLLHAITSRLINWRVNLTSIFLHTYVRRLGYTHVSALSIALHAYSNRLIHLIYIWVTGRILIHTYWLLHTCAWWILILKLVLNIFWLLIHKRLLRIAHLLRILLLLLELLLVVL